MAQTNVLPFRRRRQRLETVQAAAAQELVDATMIGLMLWSGYIIAMHAITWLASAPKSP